MSYDLNVPWSEAHGGLQRTLAFLSELGYNVVALDHTLLGKIPATVNCPIPEKLPFSVPSSLRILRRCTIVLVDPSQNHRLATVASHYDILALRPTNERSLLQACQSLECDVISLDLSTRLPFYFKMKTLSLALQRGIKFEICYAAGVLSTDGGLSRRNLISNATQLIRATRGRGIIISSEAKLALACRAPLDVVNLAAVWGLGQERGMEAVGSEARSVVMQAQMKKSSFKGVVDIIYGGEKTQRVTDEAPLGEKGRDSKVKRKADVLDDEGTEGAGKPISKRQLKRQAKEARSANANAK